MMLTEQEQFERGVAAMDAGDYAAAIAIWLPMAEAGHADAQGCVGSLYQNSPYRFPRPEDVAAWDALTQEQLESWAEEDNPIALMWLTKASDQGIGPASHNLAMLLLDYHPGLSEDEAKAKVGELMRRAWAQGFDVLLYREESFWPRPSQHCQPDNSDPINEDNTM